MLDVAFICIESHLVCLSSSGCFYLWGSAETIIIIPDQPILNPQPHSISLALTTISSIRAHSSVRLSAEMYHVRVRVLSILSLRATWICSSCGSCSVLDHCITTGKSASAQLSCTLSALVDDGTGQATLSCSDHMLCMALLPPPILPCLHKLRPLANPTYLFEHGSRGIPNCDLEKSLGEYVRPTATFAIHTRARLPGKIDSNGEFQVDVSESKVIVARNELSTSSMPRLLLFPVSITRISPRNEAYDLLAALS